MQKYIIGIKLTELGRTEPLELQVEKHLLHLSREKSENVQPVEAKKYYYLN